MAEIITLLRSNRRTYAFGAGTWPAHCSHGAVGWPSRTSTAQSAASSLIWCVQQVQPTPPTWQTVFDCMSRACTRACSGWCRGIRMDSKSAYVLCRRPASHIRVRNPSPRARPLACLPGLAAGWRYHSYCCEPSCHQHALAAEMARHDDAAAHPRSQCCAWLTTPPSRAPSKTCAGVSA
eukprot:COSAG01_NODE_4290_length_5170_cov_2.814829_6_plen_179_part_00